jgi:hypothetical protein
MVKGFVAGQLPANTRRTLRICLEGYRSRRGFFKTEKAGKSEETAMKGSLLFFL